MVCLRAATGSVLLLTLATAAFGEPAITGDRELSAVRRLLSAQARQTLSDEGERAAAMTDVAVLTDAIDNRRDRDEAAYGLLALGYSPREAADVVSGRISRRALDLARQMLSTGQAPEAVATYLDSQYQRLLARTLPLVPPIEPQLFATAYDSLIDSYAGLYNVSAALIRAMVATESGFRPEARSHAGAVGLMQLMPATARELGVNPLVPEQNIEGGVRYFAELLKMFGTTELALIAYNGGPGFARRYARKEVALYGETRDYVKKVLGRLR